MIGEASEAMSSIVGSVQSAATVIERVGGQSNDFSAIVKVIRKLAEKTTTSAEQIKRMIDAVQQSSVEAVSDIRRVVNQVQVISENSRNAQAAMEDIRSHAQKTRSIRATSPMRSESSRLPAR